jgi:hypothetical protein
MRPLSNEELEQVAGGMEEPIDLTEEEAEAARRRIIKLRQI